MVVQCFGKICSAAWLPFLLLSVASAEHFITIKDGDFVDGCNKFFVSGWNQWEVTEAAAGAPELVATNLPAWKTGPQLVRDMIQRGKDHGFNVMRTWATSVSPNYALQTSPGSYNEGIFRGLDYALDEARKAGIRVILAFTDNWHDVGGVGQFVAWSPSASNHDDFFWDATAKELYKGHVAAVINRVNSINGRVYRDDPTIMAWNLINEPRCKKCSAAVQSWIDEMAPYVKSLDTNHLLTVGEEGFYSTSGKTGLNPSWSGRWPQDEGQDSLQNHRSPSIDYVSFHSWIDNWKHVSEDFQRSWIRSHVADGRELGKPVLLQEFGKIVEAGGPSMDERNRYFQIVYDEVKKEMEGGHLQGAMFWQWYDEGQVAPKKQGYGAGKYGIYDSDGTFSHIKDFTQYVRGKNLEVAGCVDPGRSVAWPQECQQTRVGGADGTGFEGPDCSLDINECVRGTANCPKNAGCINTNGGFVCKCHYGYQENGPGECSSTVNLLQLETDFQTKGPGHLACSEGEDIQYPVGAPGFVYDPTGSVDKNQFTKGRLGSREDVTIRDCQVACYMTEGCDSFAFNPELKQCFLKKCPSQDTCYQDIMYCKSKLTGESFSCGQWQTFYSQKRSCGSATKGASAENGPSP